MRLAAPHLSYDITEIVGNRQASTALVVTLQIGGGGRTRTCTRYFYCTIIISNTHCIELCLLFITPPKFEQLRLTPIYAGTPVPNRVGFLH